ncbi:MAG: outer membrane lipoprotein-sorting protein [Spirochaetales bacterium]|nr:outer membrane lipoprotein-sorting protein [Spirochaetales bacterium]
MLKKIFLITMMTLLALEGLSAITADEIIKRLEQNEGSMEASCTIQITDSLGTKTKSFNYTKSAKGDMMLEFTNIEEKGQKILRLEDEIYLYFPDAEEIIHLQGESLKDSVMGSDFSYEDLTKENKFENKYRAVLEGEEDIDGFPCYKVVATAKSRDVVYPKQILWVDKKLFAYRKAEMFAGSGKMLKEMFVREIKVVSGKSVPTYMEMRDPLKKNNKTVFIIKNLKVDMDIPDSVFSLEELSW